jgi:hypothetical protein
MEERPWRRSVVGKKIHGEKLFTGGGTGHGDSKDRAQGAGGSAVSRVWGKKTG